MKYLILTILSVLLFSCSEGNNGNWNGDNNGSPKPGVDYRLAEQYNSFVEKNAECNIVIENNFQADLYGTRSLTEQEEIKNKNCIANIKALTCDSESIIKNDLSLVTDCLYYENTEGFPTAKDICETHLKGFCQAPRHCVDGVYCDMYEGAKPFRKSCAESGNDTGEYTCTGDYDNAPFCKPFWVEYTSGCHDEPGYIKENSFDDLCDKFENVLLIEDNSIIEQFESCYNARPQSCEGLYDLNYDISTVTECQFIFEE